MDENQTTEISQRASRRIIGMPVYSIREGSNLGNIKGFILDAREKGLLALIVERRRITKEEKMLPFRAISSIGEDVVTVERLGALERRGINPAIMNALRRPVQPLGARCFTAGGKTMGKVEEYYIDVQSGKISALEISNRGLFKGNILVDGAEIIALAPHTIMLRDEALENFRPVENQLLNSMEAAMDKAGEFTRSTANALGNSLNKIIGGKEEPGSDREPVDIPSLQSSQPQTAVTAEQPEQLEDAQALDEAPPAAATEAGPPPELDAPLQLPEHTASGSAESEDESEPPNLIVLAGQPQPELDILPLSGAVEEATADAPELAADDLELLPGLEEKPARVSELLSVEVLTPEEAAALDGFPIGSSVLDIARAAVEDGLEEAEEQPQDEAEADPAASNQEASPAEEPQEEAENDADLIVPVEADSTPASTNKKKKKKKRRKKK